MSRKYDLEMSRKCDLEMSRKCDLEMAMPGTYKYQTLAVYLEHKPPMDSPSKVLLKCLGEGPYKKGSIPPEEGAL